MLNCEGDGNENCKKKINSLISNKNKIALATLFFVLTFLCRCFARPQRDTF